jgi:hypothetical protein
MAHRVISPPTYDMDQSIFTPNHHKHHQSFIAARVRWPFCPLTKTAIAGTSKVKVRAALHLEARPNPLEANCMKNQPSTTHYNKIITGPNFPICKGVRVKKLGRFNKSSIKPFRFSHNPTDLVR